MQNILISLLILCFSIVFSTNIYANILSKEINIDDPKYVARHAVTFDDKLDGYKRWVAEEQNIEIKKSILLELYDLCTNSNQLKCGLTTFAEFMLEDEALNATTELNKCFSDLLPMYLHNIDSSFTFQADQTSIRGISVAYKRLFQTIINHDPLIASAVAKQGFHCLKESGLPQAINFMKDIYEKNSQKPEVAAIYVELCSQYDLKNNKFDRLHKAMEIAIQVERLEVDPRFYCLRGTLYCRQKNFLSALPYTRTAYHLDSSSSVLRKNLALMLSINEFYEEAIPHYYAVLKAGDYNDRLLEWELVQTLQLAGREKEAVNLLLLKFPDITKRIREWERNKALQITKMQELVSHKPSGDMPLVANAKKRIPREFKSLEEVGPSFPSISATERNLKSEYRKEKKEKVKRKGTANPHFAQTHKTEKFQLFTPASIPALHHVTVEDLLGENSKNYAIFCRFFENLEGKKKLPSVHIPMRKAQLLLTALGSDVDPAKGKGSHTKVTLSNGGFLSVNDHSEEIMVILSKKAVLLPYQIRQLRDAFLELGLYPKHLKERLIE